MSKEIVLHCEGLNPSNPPDSKHSPNEVSLGKKKKKNSESQWHCATADFFFFPLGIIKHKTVLKLKLNCEHQEMLVVRTTSQSGTETV